MQLSKVTIKNFRSIESATIDFIPTCKALIGINESGKTNVLHALSFLSPDRLPVVDDLRETRPTEKPIEEGHVRFLFRLTQADHAVILRSLTQKIYSKVPSASIFTNDSNLAAFVESAKSAFYEVDLQDQTKRARYWSFDESTVSESWLTTKPSISPDIKLPTGTATPPSLNSYSIIHKDSLPPELLTHTVPLNFNTLQRLVGEAITSHVTKHLPECFLWSYSDQQLLPPSVPISKFVQSPGSFEPLRQMFCLAGHEDVSEAIENAKSKSNGIRNLLKRVSEAATKHMRSVWKDYKGIDINVQPNGDNIEVNIQDTYNLYDFSRRSDGFKRFISFLFLVSAKTRTGTLKNVLYLHDEPDTGLHPSGARHLLSELIKVSKDNCVVYSTHSIFMIDRNRIDRHYIVTKDKEVTTLTSATNSNFSDEEVLYNALQFSAFEVIEKENILFEGWKDKRLFEFVLKGTSSSAINLRKATQHVGYCHAQGVKDIGKVSAILELANRNWIVISDGDPPAREYQKQYAEKRKDRWFRYDELTTEASIVTSEDFFETKRVQKALKDACQRHAVSSPKDLVIPDSGKLRSITSGLQSAGVSGDVIRAIVSDLKDDLIDSIKLGDVREIYFTVMLSALQKLQQLSARSQDAV